MINQPATTQSIYEKAAAEFLQLQNGLKIDRKKFEEEKNQLQKDIENIDVIRLNVGGEMMMVTRETLLHAPKSILSMMFNGRWEERLPTDENENIFLDFNPIIFRHLLDQLQVFWYK